MYTEIKYPFAHLFKNGDVVVFFEHDFNDKGKPIASWDDIHLNYPRWSLATHTKEEAIIRVKEMVENDNWELYETTEDELNDLVE